jgi:hypothetical protein
LRDLSLRYSCQLLARQNVLLGKVPTTPTIASIIGGMQSQEALKLIHDMSVEPGKVVHFNGLTNHMHTTAYVPREDCESHWVYGDITELPARAERATLHDLLRIARADLGPQAVIELDQELVTSLECPNCHTIEEVLKPLSEITFEAGHCPTCGILREASFTHTINGDENFLHRTLASVGIPALHILRAQNGTEYRFYELTGDLPDTLHFRHFQHNVKLTDANALKTGERIRLKQGIRLIDPQSTPASGRVRIKDAPTAKGLVSIQPAAAEAVHIKKKGLVKFADAKPEHVRFQGDESTSARVSPPAEEVRVKVDKE